MLDETKNIDLVKMQSQLQYLVDEVKSINKKYDKYLNTKDLSQYLKVGTKVIDYYRVHGLLPHYKMGRTILFKLSDVDKFMEGECYCPYAS
jgi:excisionase family DNA binding protein